MREHRLSAQVTISDEADYGVAFVIVTQAQDLIGRRPVVRRTRSDSPIRSNESPIRQRSGRAAARAALASLKRIAR